MSDTNQSFDNFMNKFSSEHEAEKMAELKANARRLMWKRVRRVCLLLVLLGLGATGYVFRSEVVAQTKVLHKKLNLGGGEVAQPYAKAEQNAKNKVAELKQLAEKRNNILDDTMR